MMNRQLRKGFWTSGRSAIRGGWVGWLSLAVVLTACGGGPHPVPDGISVVGIDEDYLTFGSRDTTYVDGSYRLGPGDQIELTFLFDHSLDSKILVRPDGGINLPILGDVVVAGETPGNLARRIGEAYGRYYTNPELSINLIRYAPPQCYVLGEVRYPRAVEIRPGMTVLGAIAAASGPTDAASLGNTVLLRRVANNRAVARRVNVMKFARGQAASSDLFLQDFDIIYVPRSFIGKLNSVVDMFFTRMAGAPLLYLRGWEAFHTDRVYRLPVIEGGTTTTAGSPTGPPGDTEGP